MLAAFVVGAAALHVGVPAEGVPGATLLSRADTLLTSGDDSIPDGMPSQASTDLASTDPSNTTGQAGWGDLAAGVAARPYVTSLTVINGSQSTPVIVNGTTTADDPQAGSVSALVSPYNLCRTGQAPAAGVCYATPNRVGLTIGYSTGATLGSNFADPSTPVSPQVDAGTVFDMTVALNTLGQSLRWTLVNGDLLYWRTTNLGQANATVRIKFRPAQAPYVARYPDSSGCTATPAWNCSIQSADGEVLSASLFFSLDATLDASLTGAAFATQGAFSGYLQPAGTALWPRLDVQAASTHTKSTGDPQLGTVQAFIPAAALTYLYGLLPDDAASSFLTTRTGDPGSNNAPTYTPWTAAQHGSDGLLVKVSGITFSVPKYQVKGKIIVAATKGKVAGTMTSVTSKVTGCTAKAPCLANVYSLGPASTGRYVATRTLLLKNKRVQNTVSVQVPSKLLRKGYRYLLVVHTRAGKLAGSGVGTVT